MPDRTFDLTVEEPPGMKLTMLVWNDQSPPDIVVLPSGLLLVKVGRYGAAPGDQYRYRVATVAHWTSHQLVPASQEHFKHDLA